jgi:hypothetical protein
MAAVFMFVTSMIVIGATRRALDRALGFGGRFSCLLAHA